MNLIVFDVQFRFFDAQHLWDVRAGDIDVKNTNFLALLCQTQC